MINKSIEQDKDMVNHPDHYKTNSGIETIDVIKAFTEGLEGIEATDTGNIIKYACRWKKKNGIEDLEKIVWYANHLIDHLKSETPYKKVEDPRNGIDEKINKIIQTIQNCCSYHGVRECHDIVINAHCETFLYFKFGFHGSTRGVHFNLSNLIDEENMVEMVVSRTIVEIGQLICAAE